MIYKCIIRPLLFRMDAENAHLFTFKFLRRVFSFRVCRKLATMYYQVNNPRLKKSFCGLVFSNPVGLAAGLDKDALLTDEMACLGFGFIEIGTLTPKAQEGNPKPRLFRLKSDKALINRMGFNNMGVIQAAKRLKERKNTSTIIGGNIGKNKDTPNEAAYLDYVFCFNALYDYVDYFVVNLSSPNTPGLRALQERESLDKILQALLQELKSKKVEKPIFLKIAPDLEDADLLDIIEVVKRTKIAGVVATNTTISREGLRTTSEELKRMGEGGGLSGVPLEERSTRMVQMLRKELGNNYIIIASGGIHSADTALEKINAGANLVQLYTGFIYEGPALIKKINRKLASEIRN